MTSTATPAAPPTVHYVGDPSPRPWRRYSARMIDTILGYIVAGLAIRLLLPAVAAQLDHADSSLGWYLAATAFTIPLEAVLLSRFRATPGKGLLGLRVMRDDGATLAFGAALRRTGQMWIEGLGGGIPIIRLFTMAYAKSRLETTGTTLWDGAVGTSVRYGRAMTA